MNEQLEEFARKSLKEGLEQCTPGQVNVFARMYGIPGKDETIDDLVNNLHVDKLDWAMQQVKTTLDNHQ